MTALPFLGALAMARGKRTRFRSSSVVVSDRPIIARAAPVISARFGSRSPHLSPATRPVLSRAPESERTGGGVPRLWLDRPRRRATVIAGGDRTHHDDAHREFPDEPPPAAPARLREH